MTQKKNIYPLWSHPQNSRWSKPNKELEREMVAGKQIWEGGEEENAGLGLRRCIGFILCSLNV